MSPELIKAIRERIERSQSKEEIKKEVMALGHDESIFEAAYVLALHDIKEAVIEDAGTVTSGMLVMELPKVSQLIPESFHFAKNHLHLTLLLMIPLVISYIATEVSIYFEGNQVLEIIAGAVSVVALLAYFFSFSMVLYVVGRIKKGQSSVSGSFEFVRTHFFSLMAIYIVGMLALWGGFILFIVPGIILYTSLYFAPFAFLHEEKRGINALLRSRSLVLGRWFIVTGKLLKYLLFVFFPLLIVIALYTLITELSGLGEWGRFGGEIVLEGLMAFVAVMNLFAMNELYHSLVMTEKPSSVADKSISLRYWLLVALGAVSIIGAIIATVIYMEKGGFDQLPPIVDPTALEDQVRGSHTAAATYFETNGSYEGVCEEFNTNSIDIYTINCNDSSDAWATTILYGDEIWCADTETQAKLIKQPLGDRVKCLELPQ